MKTLLCLLMLASFAMAQPVWGPYEVFNSDSTIQDLELCVRGDTAEVVWIEDTLVYHTSLNLSNGSIIDERQPALFLRGWDEQLLGELLGLEDGWACVVYQDQHGDQYPMPNLGSNLTDLVLGNEEGFQTVRLDSGWTRLHFPQLGESQNWGFSLTPLRDQTICAAWMDSYFLIFDADVHPTASIIDVGSLEVTNYRAGEQIFGGWEDRTFVFPWQSDSLLTVVQEYDLNICAFSQLDDPEYPFFSCTEFTDCGGGRLIESGRTSGGVITLIDRGDVVVPIRLERDSSGNSICTEYPSIVVYGSLNTAFHPSYGFAALQVHHARLFLARIDTTGAEVQPVGILYETDGEHFIVDADVTINDSGQVVAVWSEYTEWSDGPRELKIAWTEWDTFLDTPEQGVPSLPRELSLSAYPNPFNSTITISYELPSAGTVKLTAYDLHGRLVSTISDEFAPAGTRELRWSPENLASGVYFLNLEAPLARATQKILYLK